MSTIQLAGIARDVIIRPTSHQAQPAAVRVALLGCGTVGSCVAKNIVTQQRWLRQRAGARVTLEHILVRDAARPRDFTSKSLLSESFDAIIASKPHVIIEVLGGIEPAATYIRRAIEAGIHVITANKTVIAHYGHELRSLAAQHNVGLYYEAAVCAAIPLLQTLDALRADRVDSVKGILNGSTNYLLSRMHDNGLSQAEALAEAKERGLIEPDPSADLSGRDAAEKLCILAHELGESHVSLRDIDVSGIETITADDVLAARRLGYVLKLVATLQRTREGAQLRVQPELLRRNHPLARIAGADNGVVIRSRLAGETFLSGAGAGPEPTTSAIMNDLLRGIAGDQLQRARTRTQRTRSAATSSAARATPKLGEEQAFFVCIGRDPASSWRPHDIIEALRENGVALKRVDVVPAAARVLTHPATRCQVARAVRKVAGEAAVLVAPLIEQQREAVAQVCHHHLRTGSVF
ncbi:MAG: homoserine dehydrogenase [Phycisphaerales bacterium]